MKKFYFFLILSFTISSCINSGLHGDKVVNPQVKEMVRQIVDKEVSLKTLEIKRLEYEDNRNQIQKRDHSNANGHTMCQEIINNFKYADVTEIIYKDLHNAKDHTLIYDYRVWVSYTDTRLMLTFRKIGEDDYYFKDIELMLSSGY